MPGNYGTCSKGHYRTALVPNPVWRQRPHHVRPCRQRRNRPTPVGALATLAAPLAMLVPLVMLCPTGHAVPHWSCCARVPSVFS